MKHFLDVGANIGQTFDDFLLKTTDFDGAHVWCIEASPRHVPALMEKAKQHAQRFKVHVCPFGLADKTSILPFYQKDDERGDSFSRLLGSDKWTENLETGYELHIATVSLCEFINFISNEGDEVTIKLDCEGSEYGILADLFMNGVKLAPRIEAIHLGLHTTEQNCPKNALPLITGLERMGITFNKWEY